MADGTTTGGRLASLDALRGFDMFFITGGAGLIAGVCAALGAGQCWLVSQMGHVPWAGLAHHDTIFPLFLFLAGVSWPFSLAAQRAKGATSAKIHLKILRRVAGLFLLGLAFGGILAWKPTFRLSSVLAFIGLSWGFAALLYLHLEKPWQRATAMAVLGVGYFALLHFFSFPGAPAGADFYSKEWNVIRFFDVTVFPRHLLLPVGEGAKYLPYEPESLFSVPSGTLLALLGMMAGTILRAAIAPMRKVWILLACALGSLVLDLALIFLVGVPIVKALWTVSFIFAAAAYSFAMLALFYWIVDVRGWRKWTVVFDPVGKNSILAYSLMMFGVAGCLSNFLFKGTAAQAGAWTQALSGFFHYLTVWAIVWYLGKKNVYLKL